MSMVKTSGSAQARMTGVWLALCAALLLHVLATWIDLRDEIPYIVENWSDVPDWVSDTIVSSAASAIILSAFVTGFVALYGIRHQIRLSHYALVVAVALASTLFFQAQIGEMWIALYGVPIDAGFGLLLVGVGWVCLLALLVIAVIRAVAFLIGLNRNQQRDRHNSQPSSTTEYPR
ncbi:hypothetical protein [Microbacterium marmarense]|uniref:Uncharacterized protein n=1 Tax=Microbacterium marmarense TaxID=3122051 RepID=A0ABU8LU73_9MICO